MNKTLFGMVIVMMMTLLTTSAIALEGWSNRYTVPALLDSPFDNAPVLIPLAGVECAFEDFRDLRIYADDDVTAIPYTLDSPYGQPYETARIILDIEQDQANYAYVYCGNPEATKPIYSGMVINEVRDMGYNEEFGWTGDPLTGTAYLDITTSDGTRFVIENGQLSGIEANGHAYVDNGFLLTTWRADASTFLYGTEGATPDIECAFNSNQSQYNNSQWLDIFCSNSNGVYVDYQIYDKNVMIQIGTGNYLGDSFTAGLTMNAGNVADAQYFKYANGTDTISEPLTGELAVDVTRGLFVTYADANDYGIGAVWDVDSVASKRVISYADGWPEGRPYGSMFCVESHCEGGGLFNSETDYLQQFWIGLLPKDDIGLEQAFGERINTPLYRPTELFVPEPEEESSSSGHTRYMVDANGNVVGLVYGNQAYVQPQKENTFLSLTGGQGFDLIGWLKGLWASIFGGN